MENQGKSHKKSHEYDAAAKESNVRDKVHDDLDVAHGYQGQTFHKGSDGNQIEKYAGYKEPHDANEVEVPLEEMSNFFLDTASLTVSVRFCIDT